MKQADSSNRERIQRETADVTSEWTTLISSLEARRDVLSSLASRWEEFEALWQAFESALISCEEKSKHVDIVVRSQPHIIEAHNTLKVRDCCSFPGIFRIFLLLLWMVSYYFISIS